MQEIWYKYILYCALNYATFNYDLSASNQTDDHFIITVIIVDSRTAVPAIIPEICTKIENNIYRSNKFNM